MKTYLVPVDFSEAALHAADFAAALSHQTEVEHIILLNAYYVSVYESTLPSPDMVQLGPDEIEQNSAERIAKLESLKQSLLKKVRDGVKISTHLNRSHLLRAVVENSISKNVDLVIMGSKGNSSYSDRHLGSHVVKVAKASPIPVLIVPPVFEFEDVSRVVVACDFNRVTETVPLQALKRLLTRKHPELLVVNVDNKNKHSQHDAQQIAEETDLHAMLKQFNPKYFYINNKDVINGILHFAAEKDAQLVIALPHKYSFLQSLLHNSVSLQLAETSVVPVLLLK